MKVLFIAIILICRILMLLNACKRLFQEEIKCAFICLDIYGFGKCNVGNDIPVYFTVPKYSVGNIAIGM